MNIKYVLLIHTAMVNNKDKKCQGTSNKDHYKDSF